MDRGSLSFNLKGCQTVAGGRSRAQTSGIRSRNEMHLGGVPELLFESAGVWHAFQGANRSNPWSGGVAFAQPPATVFQPSRLMRTAVYMDSAGRAERRRRFRNGQLWWKTFARPQEKAVSRCACHRTPKGLGAASQRDITVPAQRFNAGLRTEPTESRWDG